MKKIKYFFVFLVLLSLCGCGKRANSNDVISKFTKKVNSVKSYSINGVMEINSNDETYTYNVKVDYKFDDLYKVTLTNTLNNHEQVILKNKDVYVVTPALNKSFKFQSEWPSNSSQSYLLASLVDDIKKTKDPVVDENKEYIIVNANVNYPNNKNLITEKIYFDKNGDLKEVQVLNKEGNAIIRMKFNDIKYNAKFVDDNFNLNTLVTDNDCKGEEDCKSNDSKEKTSVLDNIVYPLYLPKDTHLSTKDTIGTSNGDRVIMTYTGAKPFMIIEEVESASKEMEITSIYGDPMILSMGVGAVCSNSLEWNSGGVDYYITSSYLTGDELATIAESLNTAAVVEIKNK